jgi:hypothetical protein
MRSCCLSKIMHPATIKTMPLNPTIHIGALMDEPSVFK